MDRKIVLASREDKEEILILYRSQLGREFCPWTEHYPTEYEIEYDLSRDALFVMKAENGEILAAISQDLDEAVENLECWTKSRKPGGELSRLAVKPEYQNQGIAREMLLYGMKILKERGFRSVHFLVNRLNVKALRSYEHLHFEIVGECEMFEQPFFCYEKEL